MPNSAELSVTKSSRFIRCGSFISKDYRIKVRRRGRVNCRTAMRIARSIRSGGAGWSGTSRGELIRGKWLCKEGPGSGYCQARRGRWAEIGWSVRVTYAASTRQRSVFVGVWEQGYGTFFDQRPQVLLGRRNVRPGSISGLDTFVIRRWTVWGYPKARARAIYWWTKPDMTGHKRFPARITLSRIRRCGQVNVYTRLSATFTKRIPKGLKRKVSIPRQRVDC